tara:strand:+ start:871 stop:1029 length:159 start_codon:yes stop_codon:yes gene_type:complete
LAAAINLGVVIVYLLGMVGLGLWLARHLATGRAWLMIYAFAVVLVLLLHRWV